MGSLPPLRIHRRAIGCRVLLFYRARPDIVARLLPAGARPHVLRGHALIGVCYTRLAGMRRRWLPRQLAAASDHLAYRFPVEFERRGGAEPGSWVMRRDSSSWLGAHASDVLLRGDYRHAEFRLSEGAFGLALSVTHEGREELHLRAEATPELRGSIFSSPHEVEELLAATAGVRPHDVFAPEADDLEPETKAFAPEPLHLLEVRSAFFEDPALFPAGSAVPDSAFRMVTQRLAAAGRSSSARRLLEHGETAPAAPAL